MILISNSVKGAKSSAKVYLALLNQTGTDNPVATILNANADNFLGELNWVRNSVGYYSCSSDLFLKNKTIVNGLNPFGDGLAMENGYSLEPAIASISAGPVNVKSYVHAEKSVDKKVSIDTKNSTGIATDGIITTYGILVEIVVFD